MNTTYNTITNLANLLNTQVDDSVFCSMMDNGIDPGIAWNAVYLSEKQALLSTEVEMTTDIDDFDAVEFA
jgi:hypothetical protein